MWATGDRLKHQKKGDQSFSEENWGDSTLDYSSSILQIEPPGWKRILARASRYKQSRKGHAVNEAVEGTASALSVHASIVDTAQDDDDVSEEDASDDGVGNIGVGEGGMEEFDDVDEDEEIDAVDVDESIEDVWVDEDEV